MVGVDLSEGPIHIKRYDPAKGGTSKSAKLNTISTNMLWRLANAFLAGHPLNVDRVFASSYNTRSALESLLAHTPQFYWCNPGRIELTGTASPKQKPGHKHLLWLPDKPHRPATLVKTDTNIVISELPIAEAVYEALEIGEPAREFSIQLQRRHAQMQVALMIIGQSLGFRTWIARNDRGISYQGRRLAEFEGVTQRLHSEQILSAYGEAATAAAYIDVIWFRNHRFMPAVIEIEDSTGVYSGLTRMTTLRNLLPPIQTRWVIAAPDTDRSKVIAAANETQFRDLNALYFPYSAVEELFSLCQRRKLRGVSEEFLDCFMERCVAN